MWMVASISTVEDYIPNQDETEDGEISILFWSFAFVFLLIVTVWFYITQIAPIRRSAGQQISDKEIDREEEVARKILEQLTDDLRFKSDISKEGTLDNAASAPSGEREESSVYEYIDDEIHIHYSKYGWDDESVESSDGSSGLAAARRPSMENMDLIFPGFLPSIVEEEEIEEDSDTDHESSEKSHDKNVDDKFNADLSRLPTAYKQLVNNNEGVLESSVNIEYKLDLLDSGTKFVPFIESRKTMTKELQPKEDRVVTGEPAESQSLFAFENFNHPAIVKSISEPVNIEQNGISMLSTEIDNRCQVVDAENSKNIPSAEPASHISTQQSVLPTKCRTIAEVTSGSLDFSAPNDKMETILDNVSDVNGSAMESISLFTISSCDLAPVLKQDANEIEEPKLHALNEQKISCPPNGLDHYFTRDIRFENSKNEENARDNIENERDSELSDASMEEDTSGSTGIKMDVNKSDLADFQLNGFVDEIAGTNDHTRHAWTFFSMSGSDETTKPGKGISSPKQQRDQVEVPKIIIDSYDDGPKSDMIIPNDDSLDMNGSTPYTNSFETDTFETDIDIDDVDLIDSDELQDEGEFSIYFKRHVSVTDLDKILSEEGHSGEDLLETDLSVDKVEQSDVDISSTRTVMSSDEETNYSITASETTYGDDGSGLNIQKSIIVTSKLSDCLDKQPSEELQEFDPSLKSYEVETLMDDVSFQKDGVYGELVLSKLNDHQRDHPDDVSFDYYGEDWSEFIEDYRRERKPRLYTIPEDEEISSAEDDKGEEFESNLWSQARYNYSNGNELSVLKDPRLQAPIATMDASDSEFDLDDHSSSEAEKSGPEIDDNSKKKYQPKLPEEPNRSDKIITYNGFTKNGGINDANNVANEKEKKLKDPVFADKIISCNGVTEKLENGNEIDVASVKQKTSKEPELLDKMSAYNGMNGDNVAVGDSTRSVKIVKKIKIFVRKEVVITKDEQQLQSTEQLIEEHGDHKKDKCDTDEASNETTVGKEVDEAQIVPKCREQKIHSPYDVIKAEIDSDTNFTQPLNFEEERCDISEVIATKTEMIPKKESYTTPKPEQKVVDDFIEASVKNTPERDLTQFLTQALAQSDNSKTDAKPESKIVTDTVQVLPLSLEGDAPKSVGVEGSCKPLAKNDNGAVNNTSEAENVDSCTSPTQKEAQVRDITQTSPKRAKRKHLSKMVARFESKIEAETVNARRSSVESKVPKHDVMQDAEKLLIQSGQTKVDNKPGLEIKPENVKASVSSVEASVPKRDVTQDIEKLSVLSDQTKIDTKPESKSTLEAIQVKTTPVEEHVPKLGSTQYVEKLSQTKRDAKPDSPSAPETIQMRKSFVEEDVPTRDVQHNLEKIPVESDQTAIVTKPESTSTPRTIEARSQSIKHEDVSKRDVTKQLENSLVQNDQMTIDAASKATPETVLVNEVSLKEDTPKVVFTGFIENRPAESDLTNVDVKPESESTPVQANKSSLKAASPKRVSTEFVENLPSESDVTNVDAKPELKSTPDTMQARTSSVKEDVIKPNVEECVERLPAQIDQTQTDAKPDSKSTLATIKTTASSVQVNVLKHKVTAYVDRLPSERDTKQIDAKPDSNPTSTTIKTTASSVQEGVIKHKVTAYVDRLPVESDTKQIDIKPDSKPTPTTIKTTASSVKENVIKHDVTSYVKRLPARSDQTQIGAKPDTKSMPATIKARASSVESVAPKRGITNDIVQTPAQKDDVVIEARLQPKVTPEFKARASSVEAVSSERVIVKDFVKLPAQNDQTKSDRTDKVAKTVKKDDIQAKPKRSNVGLKLFISGKRSKEDSKTANDNGTLSPSPSEEPALAEETEVQSPESPPVTISIQGKDSPEDREGRKVRSPTRISPTPWEKKPRKTYLASRNIRLSKSHEDLRFIERAPGELQDSIQEEEYITHGVQSPSNGLSQSLLGDDVKELIQPDSIHTAKITVQEVVGDKQRILILNVKKKVHGKARWKSLSDLDSVKMAVTPPRRSSDLGNALASFAEEEEKVEGRKGPTVLPVLEVKTRRKSLEESRPEEQVVSPRRSPILKVTALQDLESVTEKDAPTKMIKARVMPVLEEGETQSDESGTEFRDKAETPRREFKARVTQISSRESKPRVEREDSDGREENRPQERVISAPIVSPVVEAIPWLEGETVTEISDSTTKGNTIKVRVARVTPTEEIPPQIEDRFSRPRSSPTVEALPKLRDEREIEARVSQISPIREVRYRHGRESGYGSFEMKDNDAGIPSTFNTLGSVHSDPVSTLGGVKERSVSSLSSIEDEFDGEILGESRIMVTDLDALLAQQTAGVTEEKPRPQSPETHEVTEKVHVWARMGPVPQKVVRINSNDQDDDENLVIHHVKSEEPIVIEPVIVTEAASNEESNVISAFLVNDGYDDDELDEVFFEDYPPYGYPNSHGNSARKHSSDADSETSSVSSLPLKHRHRQTRAALEAVNIGARNRTDSSGSSKTATPVAELENEKAATSSGSSTPEIRANESFSYKTPERSPPAAKETLTKFTSAFISLSRTTEVRRPRARSEEKSAPKSDEEPGTQTKGLGSSLQKKGLGTSVQDVETLPGLHIDQQRFKEAADSRKSMPDLTKRQHPINDSPYLRGLSAHTRKWLSQNSWMNSNEQQDEDDLMTSDLFLYPSNRFQPGSNIDASFMSLAGERDVPDDISVSSLSTRPQSPMSEFSFAGEVPYWGMRRGSTTTVKCSNPRCEQEEVLFPGEKTTYTSCPACFTYYCTRNCRRIHWSEHKKLCFFGRINSYIRSFIYLCHKKEALKFQLSKAAKEGLKKKGRGCVLVTFASAQSARKFMTTGCSFFPSPPTYSSLQDLQAEGVVSKHRVALIQNIRDYDPDEEFVLNLAIIAGKMENLPANPVPRRKVTTVLQVIKIPLSSTLKEDVSSSPSDPKTETKLFYLPKCARHEFVNENEARRHYCRNISKNLKQYGIRLKNDYPDVYEKLCLYVDQNIRFKEPLTVYGNQGKKIVMCKIMPEAGDDGKK